MHNWTRVPAGVFHAFHNTWIGDLQKALNDNLLPPDYYALGEQQAGDIGPDVLTLRTGDDDELAESQAASADLSANGGMIAVAEAPPRTSITQEAEDVAFYLARQRSMVIRHTSGDRVVALLEIISPANKHSQRTLGDFVDKVVAALEDAIHVLVIDPLPPSGRDPNGTHGAIWDRLRAGSYEPPDGLPLTLVSYAVGRTVTAYVEPIRVGSPLIDMPLFLKPDHYVPVPLVPLERTYMSAWSGVPQRWRRVIEA
jgi:hypothetical protein